MGILDWLGLAASRGEETGPDVLEKIRAALAGLPDDRARVLAAFAYLLGRVAHADHDLTDAETASMERVIRDVGGLGQEQARTVVAIAQVQSLAFRGTEDFPVAQEFAAIATDEDKRALLRCLFAVSASDSDVVVAEDNEIRRITMELKIPHAEFVNARAAVRDRLAVLRRNSSE